MFCRYYNLNYSMASFISQVLHGHRKFGERAARNLERSTGRPTGWFDNVPGRRQIEEKPPISFDYSMVDALPKQERELIESFISWRVSEYQRNRVKKYREALDHASVVSPPDAAMRKAASAAQEEPEEGNTFERFEQQHSQG